MMDREKNKDIIDETEKLNELGDNANIKQIKDNPDERENDKVNNQKGPWDSWDREERRRN